MTNYLDLCCDFTQIVCTKMTDFFCFCFFHISRAIFFSHIILGHAVFFNHARHYFRFSIVIQHNSFSGMKLFLFFNNYERGFLKNRIGSFILSAFDIYTIKLSSYAHLPKKKTHKIRQFEALINVTYDQITRYVKSIHTTQAQLFLKTVSHKLMKESKVKLS